MQLTEVYEFMYELYDAAREFIELYIINDYDEHVNNPEPFEYQI